MFSFSPDTTHKTIQLRKQKNETQTSLSPQYYVSVGRRQTFFNKQVELRQTWQVW